MKKSIILNKSYDVIFEYHNILNDEIEYVILILSTELEALEKFCTQNKIEITFKADYPPKFIQIKIKLKK